MIMETIPIHRPAAHHRTAAAATAAIIKQQ
jgi:hypothetical protein